MPRQQRSASPSAADAALLAAYDEQARRPPADLSAGVTCEQDGPVLRVVGQFRGFVSAPRDVGARGAELDRLIIRQRDYFAARGEAVEWKTWAHDTPADLPDRLRAAGFRPEPAETVLIGSADEVAGEPLLPDGVTLRAVAADADMRRIADMQSAVWRQDRSWLGDDLIARVAAGPDLIDVLVAEAAGEMIAAGRLEASPGTDFASLWGGSTVPGWRGRGVYRALVAERARRAVSRGVRHLQVDASDASAPILCRLGFRAVTTTTPYVWTPPRP